jgi:dipeptidyl aminopeptidase/acylaminoacyl peptidase
MRARTVSSAAVVLLACLGAPLASRAAEPPSAKLREPLPIEAAADTRGHNSRSPIALSPDGQWIAHTVETVDTVPRATHQYAATGFPFAEGDSRMEATITNLRTGESIRLGGSKSSSWLGVWSPDGSRIAFYSDEGGEPGVWVWSFATKKAERFPGVMARPFFGYETIRWSSDGKRLLCKLVPAGMSLAEITAMGTSLEDKRKFEKVGPGEPSVIVKTSEPAADKDKEKEKKAEPKTIGDVKWGISDLAVLDLEKRTARRLIEKENVRFYQFSPDEKSVAATVLKGWQANSQQPTYDFVVIDLATGAKRTIATEAVLTYGIEWNWTPDSKSIAYIVSGISATAAAKDKGPIVVVPAGTAGGAAKTLKAPGVPSFDPGDGEYAPVMDEKGKAFYAVGDGELWRVDPETGKGTAVGKIPGWKITTIVQPFGRPTLLTPDGKTVWVLARLAPPTAAEGIFGAYADGGKSGVFAIDLDSGASRPLLQEAKSYAAVFNVDASPKTGEVVFAATDQQHLHDLWALDTKTGKARQVTHLNPDIEEYELGQARLLEWTSMTGQALKGALLLPPGYKPGTRLPLIVFVYGGDYGSRMLNRFGFWSLATFNCHVLATRGFAVLAPDAPIRDGMPMEDLMGTVMPGVNAAVDKGFADPDRLAVMGQSYGSYCVLALITQTNRFKAAIITAAVLHPDLFADYLANQGAGIGYYEKGQGNMHGTIWEQRDRYFKNSPLFLFDRIETPLLIGQGQNDGTLIASDAIFAGLERLGKKAEYRLYEGEGHVLTQRANVLDFWKRRLDFLKQNLDLEYDSRGAVVFDKDRAKSAKPPAAAAPKAGA